MKPYSAKATFTEVAQKLFSTRESSREVAAKILASQMSGPRSFMVQGVVLHAGKPSRDWDGEEK